MSAWGDRIDATVRTISTLGTVEEVIAALGGHTEGIVADAFWEGDGDELLGALYEAGWRSHRYEAPYYWVVTDPAGAHLSYTEGDVGRGDNPSCGS